MKKMATLRPANQKANPGESERIKFASPCESVGESGGALPPYRGGAPGFANDGVRPNPIRRIDDAAAWTCHPILSTLTDAERALLIELAPTSTKDELVAKRCALPLEVVQTVRRARTAENMARLKRAWMERQQAKKKPLADVLEPAREAQAATRAIASHATGSPEMFLRRLKLNHRYGEGEPTRETLHLFAARHSGKREWSTSDMARLRAPTLVRHSIAGDVAA